jgi:hypothetical protein
MTFLANVQSSAGAPPNTSRPAYLDTQARLRRVVNSYEIDSMDPSFNIIDYLQRISHNI